MPDAPPPDLDLRLVRYFTVVADHLHFGRAAAALHLAQPSLSRQIRRLEEQLGPRLLERTPRGTRLTDAGKAFLPKARALLLSASQATAHARAAAEPSRITIGFATHIIVTPAVHRLRRCHPEAEVHTLHLDWNEQCAALLDHRVDALVSRSPLSAGQLHITVLYEEPRVVLLSRDHRLAGRASVTLDDIADEPLPRVREADPAWDAFWRVDPRPDGSPAPDGPLIDAVEDKYELIASHQAVAIAPSISSYGLRPDLVTVPLLGVAPCQVVLATRAGDHGRLVTAFRGYAQALLTGPDAHPAEPASAVPSGGAGAR